MARQKAVQSCARIIDEAEHLIHIQGYHCTSLEDIAARCRMTKANLLHHFKSKEELGLAVLDFKMKAYRDNSWNCVFSDGADPINSVRELFKRTEDFYRGNGCKAGCFVANMALEMSDLSSKFRERTAEFFEECVKRIELLLNKRRSKGYFKKSLPSRACAETILSLYEGAIMIARTQRDPAVFGRVGQTAVNMLAGYRTVGANSRGAAPIQKSDHLKLSVQST